MNKQEQHEALLKHLAMTGQGVPVELSEEITFNTHAKYLLPGMKIKQLNGEISTVEYKQRIDSDFMFLKIEGDDEPSLQKTNEKFTVIIDEEQLDKMRDDFGGLPGWCFDSCGRKIFKTIPSFKKNIQLYILK